MGKIILRLDRMMVERKMSLNELAERVGISNVNLSKIKNNKVTAVRFCGKESGGRVRQEAEGRGAYLPPLRTADCQGA